MIKLPSDFKNYLHSHPLVVITPINRYLGFSTTIQPTDQFKQAADEIGIEVMFKDPQKIIIETGADLKPRLVDESGVIDGSVYFPFGHDLLDRNMTKLIIMAAEANNAKVVNNSHCLTINDDKAMFAISLSNSGTKSAMSWICSARAPFDTILDNNPSLQSSKYLIGKTSGFTAGGVGIQPLPPHINYIAPFNWSSRSDSRPKIIQNNISVQRDNPRNKVIRTYVVGGKVIGSYYTEGEGIVNCAGLAREPKSGVFKLSDLQNKKLIAAANAVGATGFSRIDSTDEKEPAIFEINPLARIDADAHGFSVAKSILEYMLDLAKNKFYKENHE